jgi:signal transduction histidine kinase
VTLEVRAPTDLGPVRTDRTLLGHLLRNLLSNAVKFTEEGAVTMTAARHGEVLRVVVADTGIGIAEEDQDRVFEEFFQVHNMLQRSSRGSGLGLPLARRIATVLGGGLDLVSVRGRGSTFTVSLPVDGPREPIGPGPS